MQQLTYTILKTNMEEKKLLKENVVIKSLNKFNCAGHYLKLASILYCKPRPLTASGPTIITTLVNNHCQQEQQQQTIRNSNNNNKSKTSREIFNWLMKLNKN